MMTLPIMPFQAARELLRRRRGRRSLIGFSKAVDIPGKPENEDEDCEEFLEVESGIATHHRLLMQEVQTCVDTPNGRLMVFMPPGSAKSTYVSVLTPPFVMGRKPGFRVIGASYASDLARKLGRRCRAIVRQSAYRTTFGTALSSESAAADEWALKNGSEYMAGGILSGITGNRADLVLIDDPVKGRQDAESLAVRKKTMDAYQDDLMTRLLPGGSVIIVQTRWHEDDLAGAILPQGYDGQSGAIECRDGQTWRVVCLQARAERGDDPLGRKPGEYLWPEWFGREHWRQFEQNPRTWASLFQQRPSPDNGDIFQREWVQYYDTLPQGCRFYGGSDYAVSDEGDFTVHVVLAIDRDGNLYIHDLWRGKGEPDKWIEPLLDLVELHNPLCWAEEAGQINKSIGPFLRRRMAERKVFFQRRQEASTTDKVARARSFQGQMASGKVFFRRGTEWQADLISELMVFPNGRHDDQVDAITKTTQMLDRMRGAPDSQAANTMRNAFAARNAFAPRKAGTRL
ncbi:phage terminase large subunit [Aureimonas fodinaquatilis]|uniref:Phage terminase large subunit n=1 Tax=Aureimonas fodinaquatilis TaxID=2565783 RepID=A0A5B0DZ02_9HYPH|nr:phage terminase large subunit [Aureimonas fodinaquatilis]KAA0971085.1 phage terminase large subunit [Aureimonas fodinaquatilis]